MNDHKSRTSDRNWPGENGRLDDLFDALSSPARRRILTTIAEANPRHEDEFDPVTFAGDAAERDAYRTSLYHIHLPHLDESGFVSWDRETETVTRGPRFDEIAPLVQLMSDHQAELPASWP